MANKSKFAKFALTTTSGILAAILAGLVLRFVDKFEGIFAVLNPVLDLNSRVWLWLIIGIPFVGLFIVIKTIYNKNNRDKYIEKEGVISGLKFRWKESKDSIYNLQCFCPRCDYELTRDRKPYVVTFDSWALPSCPRCGFRSNALEHHDLRDIVEREIERKRRSLEQTTGTV